MPAEKHTKKAKTAAQKRQWQHVRDTAEAQGDSPKKAIMKASGVLKDPKTRSKK